MRYSPHPLTHYGRRLTVQRVGAPDTVIETGPHTSALLSNDQEAWNLAFLSFPDNDAVHDKAASASVLLRRTLQVRRDTGELDIAELEPELCVRPLLRLPPMRAVLSLLALPEPVIRAMPMYINFGPAWVQTLRTRASMLASMDDPDNAIEIVDVAQAAEYLTKFTGDAA